MSNLLKVTVPFNGLKRVTAPRTDFKVYKRKIDIYVRWNRDFVYYCSTNAYPTCKAARAAVANNYFRPIEQVKANFVK